MKNLQLYLLVAITIIFVTKNFAQPKHFDIHNGIGIEGGITQLDIFTDNFETIKGQGWIGSLSATVDIPHKWYNLSYNIQLAENKMNILGRKNNIDNKDLEIEYKLLTAQIAFLWHARIAKGHFTIDFGPMVQYNSNLDPTDIQQKDFLINGYENLSVGDISPISNFGFNGTIGVSAGFSRFMIQAHYIYGVTNMLNKLNSNSELDLSGNETKFKGNMSMIALTAMITL